jgi:hypothetical protein
LYFDGAILVQYGISAPLRESDQSFASNPEIPAFGTWGSPVSRTSVYSLRTTKADMGRLGASGSFCGLYGNGYLPAHCLFHLEAFLVAGGDLSHFSRSLSGW